MKYLICSNDEFLKPYTSANLTSAKASVVSDDLSITGRFLAASILTLTLPGILKIVTKRTYEKRCCFYFFFV